MNEAEVEKAYSERYAYLETLATRLELHVREHLNDYPRLDRVTARAKSVSRFVDKAMKEDSGQLKYSDPLDQIQDQIGVRIVTFYLQDVDAIASIVQDYYAPIESKRIIPESPKEFGYEGRHFILFVPDDLLTAELPVPHRPRFFELQIKTLFQHAWGEADHDLAYKAPSSLLPDQRRRVAFTAAQAWGADRIFGELASELLAGVEETSS